VPLIHAAEQAFSRAHERMTSHAHKAGDKRLTDWLEAFEAEHADVLRVALAEALANDDLPDVARAVLAPLADPAHQTQVLLGAVAAYSVLSQFVSAALAPATSAVSQVAWKALPELPLPPQELAVAVLKGWVDEASATTEAAKSGVNADRFGVLVATSGEPPGPEQLMQALRRGIIDDARFATGIRESRIRPEWIDVLYALRYSPVPVGEVLSAAVQNHLSPAEAKHRIDVAGLNPDDYEWLYETHGRPPGIQMLIQLWHRGAIDLATVEQAIRESDVKNKYVDAIVAGGRHLMPERTVVSAIRQGVFTNEEGIQHLLELGFNAADAAALAAEAKSTRVTVQKELSLSMIETMYAERLITRPVAAQLITKLRYDASEVEMILSLADHTRHYRMQQAAMGRIHTRYVSHKMTRAQASTALDALNIDPAGRDDALTLWTYEREANVPTLSLSQLQGAVRREVITFPEFKSRVLALGYAEADLLPLYAEAWPPTSAPNKLP
jgi:hypothetical protein